MLIHLTQSFGQLNIDFWSAQPDHYAIEYPVPIHLIQPFGQLNIQFWSA